MSANNLIYSPEDDNDPRPYVEIIVARLGGQLRSHETHYGRFYSIHDWVHHISGSKSKDRYEAWNDLKFKMEKQRALSDGNIYISQREFQSSNGNLVALDACDEAGLYYIFQFIYQEEPNDTIKSVRKYLADAGETFDKIRREPDRGIEFERWLKERREGKINRKRFIDAITYVLVHIEKWMYGKATNTIYIQLWGRATEVLEHQLNVKDKGNLRDKLSQTALSYLSIAEGLCADKLGDKQNLYFDEAHEIIRLVASFVGNQVQQYQEFTQKDMITGTELLTGDDADWYTEEGERRGLNLIGDEGKFLPD